MDRKRILRVGAIVVAAGATGFVVQMQSERQQPRVAAASVALTPTGLDLIEPDSVVMLSDSETAPEPDPGIVRHKVDPDRITTPEPVAEAACSEDMALIAQPGAMLDLGLLAPCRPNQRVLIRHAGLVVTGRTSAEGTLIATIPALQSPAAVTLAFADGGDVSEQVEVADLAEFDRFAVQWMEDDAFQLHAFEHGAGYGDPGHISAIAPRKASAEGGFLSIIGDDRAERPLMAEVFTWPAGTRALSGRVELSIEAAVTEATCGREILGETLQLTSGRLSLRELTVAMPGCEAVGEFIVLPNPVEAEKLAAN